MENSKNSDALNKLIEINNDRIEGYETALEDNKNLTGEQIQLVSQQQTALTADHDRVKALRDASAK